MTRIRWASTVSPEPGDRFCAGLGFVAGAAERSFLVSVPFDVEFSGGMVNVHSADRWAQIDHGGRARAG